MKVKINSIELWIAWVWWNKHLEFELSKFPTFIELDPAMLSYVMDIKEFEVDEITRHRLRIVTGPHAKAIIKAFFIRNDTCQE